MKIMNTIELGSVSLFLIMTFSSCTPQPEPTDAEKAFPSETQKPVLTSQPADTRVRSEDGMVMVFVPAGEFMMGSTDEQIAEMILECVDRSGEDSGCRKEVYAERQLAHTVGLDSFWIDQTEVTNAMYTAFLNVQGNQSEEGVRWLEPGAGHRGIVYGHIQENDNDFRTRDGFESHPVIEVSWYGAAAYCAWVGGRLPTEAEWEYAARGPEANIYPWGDNFDGERTNFCDQRCSYQWRDTRSDDGAIRWAPVGRYPDGASWIGALDMAGNVHEWVNDWWSEDYYAHSPTQNPGDPDSGTLHVARGGSWFDELYRMSSFGRKGLTASSARMHWVGFRCVTD